MGHGTTSTATPIPSDIPPLEGARPPTLSEKALFDAYTEAVKGALDAATSAADKVLTAVFTLATVYAAYIGLVKPDKTAAPINVGAPFLALAIVGIAAMLALVIGVGAGEQRTVEDVRKALSNVTMTKQILAGVAVVAVVVALGLATLVVINTYG